MFFRRFFSIRNANTKFSLSEDIYNQKKDIDEIKFIVVVL